MVDVVERPRRHAVAEVVAPARSVEFNRRRSLRPLVQLHLYHEYPQIGLIEVGPRSADAHQRPPRSRGYCEGAGTPSQWTQPSRDGTTAGPPSRPDGTSRPRAFPPVTLDGWRDGPPRRFPRSPLKPSTGSTPSDVAGSHRGLPAGVLDRPEGSDTNTMRVCVADPVQIHQIRACGLPWEAFSRWFLTFAFPLIQGTPGMVESSSDNGGMDQHC